MSKEKLRAFNTLQNDKFLFADRELLKEKDPNNEALSVHAGPGKRSGEILFALLDHASPEDIQEHRVVVMETLNEEANQQSEATERKALMQFFKENLSVINPEAVIDEAEFAKQSIETLLELKSETEKAIKAAKEQTETIEIRTFLTANDVKYHEKLGLKKLKIAKAEFLKGKTKIEKAAATKKAAALELSIEKETADEEAAIKLKADKKEIELIIAFLTSNEVEFDPESTLEQLREIQKAFPGKSEETSGEPAAEEKKPEAPVVDEKKEDNPASEENKAAESTEEKKK